MALGKVAAPWVSKYFFDAPKKLAFEKVYWPFFLIEKKRYAGNWWQRSLEKPDKTDVKGLESVRRDSCKLVSNTVDKMIRALLTTCNVGNMVKVACSAIDQIQSDTIDPFLLKISKALSKEPKNYCPMPPHAKLALKMAKREAAHWLAQLSDSERKQRERRLELQWNGNMRPSDSRYRKATFKDLLDEAKDDPHIVVQAGKMGDRVSYFIIARGAEKGKHKLKTSEKAEDLEYVLKHKMPFDRTYYLENQLKGPVGRLLEPLVPGCTEKIFSSTQCTLYIPPGGIKRDAAVAAPASAVPDASLPKQHVIEPVKQVQIPKAAKKPSKRDPLPGQLNLHMQLLAPVASRKRPQEEVLADLYNESLKKQKALADKVTVDGQRKLFSDVLITAPKHDLLKPCGPDAVVIERRPRLHTASCGTEQGTLGHFGANATHCLSCGLGMPEVDMPYCTECLPRAPVLLPKDTRQYERDMVVHRKRIDAYWQQQAQEAQALYEKCWAVCVACQKTSSIEALNECRNTDCSLFFKREQVKDRKESTDKIKQRLARKPIEIEYEPMN
jgi:hypothetical protein